MVNKKHATKNIINNKIIDMVLFVIKNVPKKSYMVPISILRCFNKS